MSTNPTPRLRNRSSAAPTPAPAPPTTRSRKTSSVVITVEPPPAPKMPGGWSTSTRASSSKAGSAIGGPKPLWNSAKINAPAEAGNGGGSGSRPSSALAQHASSTAAAGGTAGKRTLSRPSSSAGLASTSAAIEGSFEERQRRATEQQDSKTEPIQSYLRIRPAPLNLAQPASHIHLVDDTEIHMIPPASHRLNPSATSSSLYALSGGGLTPLPNSPLLPTGETSSFKFTRVFPPSNDSQQYFFEHTTLPLVRDFLAGQNCLLFAYGPTGSGKTWTIQGGEGENRGILPRVMDVVWESMKGKESGSQFRSSRVTGDIPEPSRRPSRAHKASMTPLQPAVPFPTTATPAGEATPIALEEGYEYSIWVSYAEVYNEKIYDLLQSPTPAPPPSTPTPSLSSGWGARAKAMMTGGLKSVQTVKRNALSLKADKSSPTGHKIVAGMQELRVSSSDEAQRILEKGQANRRVYGHLANRVSSRSHSIFTIRLVKSRKGADPEDEGQATSSRFSIVDLAGSERVVNTGTTGDRFKEACSINNSLMVLRQCMKVLRENQERDKSRKPAVVPFRHSKLTELFQSFFAGDGNAVLVVNVNPYETSFDENKEVMKFAAVANGVLTNKEQPKVVPVAASAPVREPRVVRLSMVEGGDEEDVIYEEEDAEEDIGDDDEAEDAFVEALLDELAEMRSALYEAQLHAAMVEAQAQANTIAFADAKLAEMQKHYEKRMKDQAAEAEFKLDAKLDILTRRYAPITSPSNNTTFDDSDEEEELDEDELEEGDGDIVAETPASVSSQDSPATLASNHGASASTSFAFDSPVPVRNHGGPTKMLTDLGNLSIDDNAAEEESEDGEVPLNDAGPSVVAHSEDDGEEDDDVDVGAFDQSVVLHKTKGKKSKPKRKLGGHHVKDADAIESIAGAFSPAPKARSSLGLVPTKSSSLRSLSSRA